MSNSVLIIDDSGYSRMTIRGIIEDAGYSVIGEAKNGEEALDKIVELKPDVVTLDNILPDMTGIQILKILRDQSIVTKIIMISAVAQRSAIEEAKGLGVSAYIIKPFTSSQIINELAKL